MLFQTPQIWNPIVPVSTLTMLAVSAYCDGLFDHSPCIFVAAFGFAYAKITLKLVVSIYCYLFMCIYLKLTFIDSVS